MKGGERWTGDDRISTAAVVASNASVLFAAASVAVVTM